MGCYDPRAVGGYLAPTRAMQLLFLELAMSCRILRASLIDKHENSEKRVSDARPMDGEERKLKLKLKVSELFVIFLGGEQCVIPRWME